MTEDQVTIVESGENKDFFPKTWIDIFAGMLISPLNTLKKLDASCLLSTDTSILLGAALAVFICSLASAAPGAYSSTSSGILLKIVGSLLGNFFFWFVLASFARLLAAILKIETSIRYCLVVTGWAFAPLIFKGIAACFSNATIAGDIVSACFSAWFLFLELFAFDAILKLGRLKTLGIIIILPPCLFFAYFMSMLFAGIMLSNGLS